jgi:hypothetical protein
MRPHRALKFGGEVRTPAMQAGPTTRRLTLKEIFPRAAVLGVSEKVMFGQSTVSVMFNETQALAAQEQLMTEAPGILCWLAVPATTNRRSHRPREDAVQTTLAENPAYPPRKHSECPPLEMSGEFLERETAELGRSLRSSFHRWTHSLPTLARLCSPCRNAAFVPRLHSFFS